MKTVAKVYEVDSLSLPSSVHPAYYGTWWSWFASYSFLAYLGKNTEKVAKNPIIRRAGMFRLLRQSFTNVTLVLLRKLMHISHDNVCCILSLDGKIHHGTCIHLNHFIYALNFLFCLCIHAFIICTCSLQITTDQWQIHWTRWVLKCLRFTYFTMNVCMCYTPCTAVWDFQLAKLMPEFRL